MAIFGGCYPKIKLVSTPTGAARLEREYTMAELEAGSVRREEEGRREREAKAKGMVYSSTFDGSYFPDKTELAELKSHFQVGDQIWSLAGNERGWVIIRKNIAIHEDGVVYQLLKKLRANQALVPTPASVTPAADAPVAPDAGAAHL